MNVRRFFSCHKLFEGGSQEKFKKFKSRFRYLRIWIKIWYSRLFKFFQKHYEIAVVWYFTLKSSRILSFLPFLICKCKKYGKILFLNHHILLPKKRLHISIPFFLILNITCQMFNKNKKRFCLGISESILR